MLYEKILVDFFASPRHQKCVLYILSLASYPRVLMDVCLLRQVQFLRYLLESKLHHERGRPLSKGLINDSEIRGNLSPKKEYFLVSLEPEILINETPQTARYWLSGDNKISLEHYESPPQLGVKRGRPRSLEEFFLTLCRLRQGICGKPLFSSV